MTWPWRISSELRTISATLAQLSLKVNKIMADQDALNAIAQRIEADVTGEGAALQTIKDAIAALQATASQGQPLDFTAINQAVNDLDGKLADIQQVAASTQAPPAGT